MPFIKMFLEIQRDGLSYQMNIWVPLEKGSKSFRRGFKRRDLVLYRTIVLVKINLVIRGGDGVETMT